tara:strand:+ start:1006 stop:1257 length:252 start_codon:yes stop_codon:yes gene_type:complete
MALEKITKIDKIEIVGDYKILQVRTATIISEDNNELSRSFHREALVPGTDVSDKDQEIIDLANLLWTQEIIDAYNESLTTYEQ